MRKYVLWSVWLTAVMIMMTGCSTGGSTVQSISQLNEAEAKDPAYFMAGRIDAGEKADIASKISAKAAEIKVDVGSKVEKDQPVIILDSKDLEAQVAQAQAGVNTAKANLKKILSGARPEQISQAQAALESAKTSYDNAQTTNDRNQELFKSGAISKSQLEQSQNALATAEATYKSAKNALDMLQSGETPETIAVFQSQLKQAQAGLDIATTQLANATIVSPVSGIVSTRSINTGELALAGAPLLTVVNSDAVLVNAYLPAEQISKIKKGQEVVIKVSEIPDKEYNGEISVIDSVIDPKSKNILVKVKFKNQDSLLTPGMFAEIALKN